MQHTLSGRETIKEHPHSTDTAGKHMVTNICSGRPGDTVNDYLKKIRQHDANIKVSSYIYVVDDNEILLGYIPITKLLRADSGAHLVELMDKNVVSVHLNTDRERAARLAIHHELGALPVVNKDRRLLGVLDSHDISRILHEEHVEDMLRVAGFRHAHEGTFINVLRARTSEMIRSRTPWLIIGLAGGMLATFVVSIFKESLERHVALAFFIPALLYMASAVGTQTEALYLRLYDTAEFKIRTYIIREIKIGAAIGLICSMLIFLFTFAFFKESKIAIIISVSMFVTILFAVCIATLIPAILVKLKKDPVLGAGPFATVATDVLTILAYFIVAQIIL